MGFILRILLANHLDFSADEMIHGPHSIGFIESGKLQIMDQDAVWFFLTNIMIKIFGVSIFGIRILQVLFDSLAIILVYLIGKEIFNEKIALIASIIYTFSPFQLMQMRSLMDLPMSFFVFFAIYFLIMFTKTSKRNFFILSWVSLGVAIMIKQIALWFIPAFVIFLLYNNKKVLKRFDFKKIILAAVIIIIMVLPVLTFNYLLYKDKKLADLQFARFTKTGFEKYEAIANTIQPFSLNRLLFPQENNQKPGIYQSVYKFRFENFLVMILSVLGLFFLFKDKNKFTLLLVLSFLFPFIFLAGTSTLFNHFVFTILYVALLASLSINKLTDKLKQEKTRKTVLFIVLAAIIIISMTKINKEANGIFSKNELGKMISFKNEKIEKDSLVIVDSRIYRGRIVFMFSDRHYLETNYFSALLQSMNSLPGKSVPTTTYFIEAVTDDSGWGTVKDQPEFNQTTEDIASYFKNNSQQLTTIYDIENKEHFKVYRVNLMLKESVLLSADTTHEWFYYPVAYKPKGSSFDDYIIHNSLDSLLNKLSFLILYIDVFLSILLSFYVFFLLYKSS